MVGPVFSGVIDPMALHVSRLALGAVFVLAGLSKALESEKTAQLLVDRFGVKRRLSRWIAWSLAPLETVLGLLLVMGWALPLVSGATLALLALFVAGLARARRLGHTYLDCGCFGGGGSAPRSVRRLVARNLLLMVPALVVLALSTAAAQPVARSGDGVLVAAMLVAGTFLLIALCRAVARVRTLRRSWG